MQGPVRLSRSITSTTPNKSLGIIATILLHYYYGISHTSTFILSIIQYSRLKSQYIDTHTSITPIPHPPPPGRHGDIRDGYNTYTVTRSPPSPPPAIPTPRLSSALQPQPHPSTEPLANPEIWEHGPTSPPAPASPWASSSAC